MSNECEHGQLARSCNYCEWARDEAEFEKRIAELEAEVARVGSINEKVNIKFNKRGRELDNLERQVAALYLSNHVLKAKLDKALAALEVNP